MIPRRLVWWVCGAAAIVLAIALIRVVASDAPSPPTATARVDFSAVVTRNDPWAIGFGMSTYGATPLTVPAERTAERVLDARLVRIPIGVRDGRLASSAAGAHPVDVVALVRLYRSWGYHVLVVIGGRTGDVDVAPGDTTRIVSTLGYGADLQYAAPNEPTKSGHDLASAIAQARMIVAEGRALHSDFRLWGPAWVDYDAGVFAQYAHALGSSLAGIDYHRYAMGESWTTTPLAFATTREMGQEVTDTRRMLTSIGGPPHVSVDETNLSWRYEDGYRGGDDERLFGPVATVWLAAACGNILLAGGQCVPYASQNGALGLTVEAGGPNPDHRQPATPMPAYWGVAVWTGAGKYPHMGGTFYSVTGGDTDLQLFAVDNVSGGRNLVIMNTGTQQRTVTLTLRGIGAGAYVEYATDPDRPYHAFTPVARGTQRGSVTAVVRGTSVVTVVLDDDRTIN